MKQATAAVITITPTRTGIAFASVPACNPWTATIHSAGYDSQCTPRQTVRGILRLHHDVICTAAIRYIATTPHATAPGRYEIVIGTRISFQAICSQSSATSAARCTPVKITVSRAM